MKVVNNCHVWDCGIKKDIDKYRISDDLSKGEGVITTEFKILPTRLINQQKNLHSLSH